MDCGQKLQKVVEDLQKRLSKANGCDKRGVEVIDRSSHFDTHFVLLQGTRRTTGAIKQWVYMFQCGSNSRTTQTLLLVITDQKKLYGTFFLFEPFRKDGLHITLGQKNVLQRDVYTFKNPLNPITTIYVR